MSSLLWLLLMQLLSNHLVACLPKVDKRPEPTSRIGIVGAGPAGLHMAYLLRNLGFNNILILESNDKVGGRSVSVRQAEADQPALIHELGTCYVSGDYTDLRRMARQIQYNLDEAILPAAVIRKSAQMPGQQLNLEKFVLSRVRSLDPTLPANASDNEVKQQIKNASERYLKLRSEVFEDAQPDYQEFPLVQPSSEAMAKLNCSVLKYLEINGLLALEPYFLFAMTSMGYGSPSDTSALYGLMWMSPPYLTDLLVPRQNSRLGMLRAGFQTFWESASDWLRRAGGVRLRLNSKVRGVNRGSQTVQIKLEDGSIETVDWLIWTPSVQSITDAHLFDDLTMNEKDTFSRLKSRTFLTKLVRFSGRPAIAADPVAYYLDQLDTTEPSLSRLMAVRNSQLALNPPNFGRAVESPSSSTLVAYYLSGYSGNKDSNLDNNDLLNDPLANGTTLRAIEFNYMPRFSISEMAGGILWHVLRNIQGAKRTWFAGHSVSFDSVKSVMKYNKMLVRVTFPEYQNMLREI